ncbi:hypothetical protein Hanom_Chr14g01257101 [Helianthus anomalus]
MYLEKVVVVKGEPDDDGGLLPSMATLVATMALLSGFIDDDDHFGSNSIYVELFSDHGGLLLAWQLCLQL